MRINRPGILINLALLFFSIIVALILSEVVIRILGWSPMYVSPERDRYWKYDPMLGWAQKPGQEGIFETPQFHTMVHINQQGLRGRDYTYDRSNNTGRILVLGDSFAWGYGVEESQRFSELLEKSLGVEVINAGISGYSTDQELIWFKSEGIKYKPDLVIVVMAGNDVGDNSRPLVNTIYYKPMFAFEDGHLVQKNNPVPRTSPQGKFVYYFSQHSALFYFLVQRYFDFHTIVGNFKTNLDGVSPSILSGSPTFKPFELTITLLHEIQKIASSEESKFMIVATDSWWNGPSGTTYKDFIDALRSEGFLVMDVKSMPDFNPGKMLIPEDGHWNSAGHEFVAEKIREFIVSDQLLIQAQHQGEKLGGQ